MRVKLNDGAPRSKAEVSINVSKNGNTLEIGIDGTVAPIVLEYYEGKVRLRVYGENLDGNQKPIFVSDLSATPAVLTAPFVPKGNEPVVAASATTDDELAAFDAA